MPSQLAVESGINSKQSKPLPDPMARLHALCGDKMKTHLKATFVAIAVALVMVFGAAGMSDARTPGKTYSGKASWYGPGFHGRKTASGERFNQNAMTAAHRSLPFGTKVRVTNKRNGRSVVLRINDRGPFTGGRIIDLSKAAASRIGLIASGTAPVTVRILR